METDNLDVVDKISRTGILIHKSVHYKRRRDLEVQGISSVWIQLTYPGRKPVLVQALYRQFRRLGKAGSHNPASQKQRWELIIKKWEQALLENKEIITMGDLNLNCRRWNVQTKDMNNYDRVQKPMSSSLQERILDKGTLLLNETTPTWNRNHPLAVPSVLDLMFTNRREKLINHQSGISSFSDHSLQILTRSSKEIITTPEFIRMRSYKEFDVNQYRENIVNHQFYIETFYEKEPDIITANIQQIVQESLDPLAKIKKLKIT